MAIPIIGDIINSVINKGADLIGKRIGDKDLATQLTHDFKSLMLESSTQLELSVNEIVKGQLEIAKEQAKHPSIFVAGARPFLMWVCGVGIAWAFVAQPIMQWFAFLGGIDLTGGPELNPAQLMALVSGMLGLTGYRTYEKKSGVARENLKPVLE